MKEWVVSVHQGGGIERLALEPFTLVGATTCPGALSEPFRSRFGIHLRLEHYGEEDLAELVIRAAEGMEIAATAQAAREIARRARGTPREALRILDRSRDVAELRGSKVLDQAHVGEAAGRLGIDLNGLDPVDRKAVKLLLKLGRPIGQEALAARLGIDRATFHQVHEPYLERLGLIEPTERGRVATEEARRLYGQEPAAPTWAASPAAAPEPRLAVEVGERDCSLSPLTDPDVRISRIRFLGPWIRYLARNAEWTHRAGGKAYTFSSRLNVSHDIPACCARRLSHRCHIRPTQYRKRWIAYEFPVIP